MAKGIGSILKEARVAKKLTLAEVEEKTNIRANYLDAVEKEDFSKIPGEVFTKGIIRTYGNFLGLEGAELVDIYKARQTGKSIEEVSQEGAIRENSNVKVSISLKQKRDWGTGNGFSLSSLKLPVKQLAMGLGALIVLGVMYVAVPKVIDLVKSQPQPTPAATQVQKPEVKPEPKPVIADKVELQVEATGKCWTEVNGDGKEIFAGMLTAGDKKVFNAKEKLVIKYGNIGVIKSMVNGQPVDTQGEHGVVVKTYLLGQPVNPPKAEQASVGEKK